MKEVIKIFEQLKNEPSKNGKESIIKQGINNKTFDYICRYLFDDLLVSGIARKRLNKFKSQYNHLAGCSQTIEDLIEYTLANNTGSDDAVRNVINSANFISEGDEEITELIYSIICKDLKLGCQVSTYNKANPNNPIIAHETMGGKAWDEARALKIVKSGDVLYASEKIDGNKGTRNKSCTDIISRNGKTWEGTETILKELNTIVGSERVPEGELVYHDPTGKMNSQEIRAMTSSIMGDKSITDKTTHGIVFKLFDAPLQEDYNSSDFGESYAKRRDYLDSLQQGKFVKVVPIEFIIATEEDVLTIMPRLKEYINSGKEGLMTIAGRQAYKTGKGYQMMKLKNVLTADLKIVDWKTGKEKTKWEGKFASFTVEFPYVDDKGVCGIYRVDVGTGYVDEFRNKVNEDPDSYIGKLMEILVTEVSKNKEGGYSFSYARMVEIRNDKNTIDLEGHSLVEIDGEYYFKKD